MALTDKKRRAVDQLHALTVDIQRKIELAIDEAEDVLPPGALPGMLKNAMMSVMAVRDVLWWVLHNSEPATMPPDDTSAPRLRAVQDGGHSA